MGYSKNVTNVGASIARPNIEEITKKPKRRTKEMNKNAKTIGTVERATLSNKNVVYFSLLLKIKNIIKNKDPCCGLRLLYLRI